MMYCIGSWWKGVLLRPRRGQDPEFGEVLTAGTGGLLFCLPVNDLTSKVAVKQAAERDEDEAQHEDQSPVQTDGPLRTGRAACVW